VSIRRKLLVTLLSALVLVGVAASAATWLAVRKEADQLFDYQLRQMALSLRDQTLRGRAGFLNRFDYDFIVQVWDPGGALVYLSNYGILIPPSRNGYATVEVHGEDWRVFTLGQADKTIQVAAPVSLRNDRAVQMALRILVPILASIPLFAVLIWLVVGKELKPLEDIADAIRRRAPTSLEPIPARELPNEVQPLVTELNELLGRLREAIEAQRRFTADAAHELRSPLTALQLQIQLIERARSPEEVREALDALRAGAKRASRLVEQLLTMAQLEPDAAQEAAAEVELDRIAAAVVAELEPLAEAKGVALRLGSIEPTRITGHAPAIETLVRNLVDNALRYTPSGGRVTVEARNGMLEVSDTGPGIAPEERARVFDRFYRVPGTAVGGSGLGLSIVKRIADAHRAEISLGDAGEGKGLRVCVRFLLPQNHPFGDSQARDMR
jgi:two-component system OmpR family sensor kinase